jgi:hypothetical protein
LNSKLHLHIKFVIVILASVVAIISGTNYVYGQAQSTNDTSSGSEMSPPNFELPSSSSSSTNSDSYFSEFMSEQNFANFSNFDSSADYEMPQIYFPDVNGTYINSDIGYQIDLPKGWKGKEMNFMMNMVFATPHEINLEEIEEPGTMMTISGINKKSFDMLTYLTQLPSVEEGSKEELAAGIKENNEQFLQNSNSLGNSTADSIMDSCNEFQTSPVTINGISAEQLTADCIDENGVNTKAKVYAFVTSDDSIIITLYYSNSINEYNQYLPLFEESVKTIKITNPSDISKSETYKKYKELGIAIK